MTNEQLLIGLLGFTVSTVLAIGGILVGFLWGKRRGNGGRENAGEKDPSFWLMELSKLQAALTLLTQTTEKCELRQIAVYEKLEEMIDIMKTQGRCRYAPPSEN